MAQIIKLYKMDYLVFTRSRPYKKNDDCFVEQKNFTHERELFGYERFEDPKLIDLMNEIYILTTGIHFKTFLYPIAN